jgi:hypothetical protein
MIDFFLHQSLDRNIEAGRRRSILRFRSSAKGEKRLMGVTSRHGPLRRNAVQGCVKEEAKSRPLIDR